MDTAESSAPCARPSTEDHDDTVEAHYPGPERPRPHACAGGRVYVGYVDEHGEERRRPTPAAAAPIVLLGSSGNLQDDNSCPECDGTGWVPYRSETLDGGYEEAYRLCPQGHSPRYCMGSSSSGELCSRPATVRCGLGYYCKEHSAVTHDGREANGHCDAV